VNNHLSFASGADVLASVGHRLGPGDWLCVDQQRIDAFAKATSDFQWIHVDAERAASGPFGSTIAHGFLSLSMVAPLLGALLRFQHLAMSLNYGCEKVRFPAPVPVNARLRAHGEVISAQRIADSPDTVQATIRVTVEIEGTAKPACVADSVSRWYFDPASTNNGGIAGPGVSEG
jgi:acyl dehydratase